MTERRSSVLIVDDSEAVRHLVSRALDEEGMVVMQAADGKEALPFVLNKSPDLIILDLGLPDIDGVELLQQIRATSNVPVVLLTARAEEADRVIGLNKGADDYVVKPFSPKELAARVRAILRRAGADVTPDTRLDFGELVIDPVTRDVIVDGAIVACTAKEFDLLHHLARYPRQVFSREQLLRSVWDSSQEWQDPRTVNEHVRRVRTKIEPDPTNPRWLISVRGVGYRFQP